MGNPISKISIDPGNNSVSFNIVSVSNPPSYTFYYWPSLTASNALFKVEFGNKNNTRVLLTLFNPDQTVFLTFILGFYPIPSQTVSLSLQICGNTIYLMDLSSTNIIGKYIDGYDFINPAAAISGDGTNCAVILDTPQKSSFTDCLLKPVQSQVNPNFSEDVFPWWGIFLIVFFGVCAIIGISLGIVLTKRTKK